MKNPQIYIRMSLKLFSLFKILFYSGLIVSVFALILPLQVSGEEKPVKEDKKILIIYQSQATMPWYAEVNKTITEELGASEKYNITIDAEYIDTRRNPGREYRERLFELLRIKYSRLNYDCIIVFNDAMDILIANRKDLFKGTPVVFSFNSIYENKYSHIIDSMSLNGNPVTGIVQGDEKSVITRTVETIRRIQPGTEKIAVIAGTSARGSFLAETAEEVLKSQKKPLDYTMLTDMPLKSTLEDIKKLPENSAVLYLLLALDSGGNLFIPAETAQVIAENSNSPVYSIYESFLGKGVLGGNMFSFHNEGEMLADLILRVLAGEKASSIPVGRYGGTDVFDWRELKRWGVKENLLPPESRISYREKSILEQHRQEITAALVFVALLLVLIVLLLVNIGKRRSAEAELKKSHDELEIKVQERTAELSSTVTRLNRSIEEIKVLQGILPICTNCRKIRDDKGYWSMLEEYISNHSGVDFSHSICPDCAEELYPFLKEKGILAGHRHDEKKGKGEEPHES